MGTLDAVVQLILSAEVRLDSTYRAAEAKVCGKSEAQLLARDRRYAKSYWSGRKTLNELATETGLGEHRVWLILNAFANENLNLQSEAEGHKIRGRARSNEPPP